MSLKNTQKNAKQHGGSLPTLAKSANGHKRKNNSLVSIKKVWAMVLPGGLSPQFYLQKCF